MSSAGIVVVGGSTAGATTMRELRRRGHDGRITLLDPDDGANRPPLSKAVLADDHSDGSVLMDHSALDVSHIRSAATQLDVEGRRVVDADGTSHDYDSLVIATGSRARRVAAEGQLGEIVLRTLTDAQTLRSRIATSSSAIVVGAGFLGLEVATAASKAGADVTVIDPDPPLQRLLGTHLADAITQRAAAWGIVFRQSTATLVGNPVHGVRLGDDTILRADLVVSCVGDRPATGWLAGTGLTTPHGVEIDSSARTKLPRVFAVGDVAAVRTGVTASRAPFWANAVTQGRVAAAAILDQPADDPITDNYFWTEIAGLSLKAIGPLPVTGTPTVLEDVGSGAGLFTWDNTTVVALGVRRSVPKLRSIARDLTRLTP